MVGLVRVAKYSPNMVHISLPSLFYLHIHQHVSVGFKPVGFTIGMLCKHLMSSQSIIFCYTNMLVMFISLGSFFSRSSVSVSRDA